MERRRAISVAAVISGALARRRPRDHGQCRHPRRPQQRQGGSAHARRRDPAHHDHLRRRAGGGNRDDRPIIDWARHPPARTKTAAATTASTAVVNVTTDRAHTTTDEPRGPPCRAPRATPADTARWGREGRTRSSVCARQRTTTPRGDGWSRARRGPERADASVVLVNVMAASRPATTATVPAAPRSVSGAGRHHRPAAGDEHGRDASATHARIDRGQPSRP